MSRKEIYRWLTTAIILGFVASGASAQSGLGEVTLFGEEEFTIEAATKTEIPLSQAPGPVTVISAKQIRESGARGIPEALRLIAGVNVRWNPMVQTIDMRSFGQNPFTSRVLLLIDGVPYNSWNKGGFPQHPGLDFFNLQNIKRIEVLRGPGSALYGENAYWGVINIVSMSGEDLEGGRLQLFGGDLESQIASVSYGKSFGEDASFLVSARATNGQFPTELWFEDNDAEVAAGDVYIKGRYKNLEASYYRYEDDADGYSDPVPVPGLPPVAFTSIDEIKQEVDIFALKYEQKFADDKFSFSGDVSFAQRDGSHCGACHAALQDPLFRDTTEDHGSQLIGDFRLGIHGLPNHDILLGLEAREIESGDHSHELLGGGHPTEGVVLEYTKVAFYAQDQISLADDKLQLILGARYDGSNDLFDDEVSPRIAAVYAPNDSWVFRAGWGQAFRFPNFSELYQDSWFFNVSNPDIGLAIPFGSFVPNPDLQPEAIETIDLGLQYRISENVSAKLDLFHSEVDDFIVLTFVNGALVNENHPDQATITGAEFELRFTAKDKFNGFFNYSYQDQEQDGNLTDSAGNPYEFVYAPANKFNAGAYFGPFKGLSGSIEVQWRDEVEYPSMWNLIINQTPGTATLDSYTQLNMRLNYEFPAFWDAANPPRLSFFGKNLLDEEAIETFVGTGPVMVGRTFYGMVEVWF